MLHLELFVLFRYQLNDEYSHLCIKLHIIGKRLAFPQCVVTHFFNPLTLQPEQSGGQGSILGRVLLLERHDKASLI